MKQDNARITISTTALEDLLFQSAELILSLYDDPIGCTLGGVLNADKSKTAEENAYHWVSEYYNQVTAVVHTVNTALSIITDAIANTEIEIVPTAKKAKEC